MSPVSKFKKNVPNKSVIRRASFAAALLGETAFWTGMLTAARKYPSGYDWRYITESNLVNPESNPAGYLWGVTGVALCGLCWFWWTVVLQRLREQEGVADPPWGIRSLQFGIFFMICTAVVPRWLLPVEKGHEILATLTIAGFCVGVIRLMYYVVKSAMMRNIGSVVHARFYAVVAAGTAVSPILLAVLTQAYVHYFLPELPWVNRNWRALGVPAYLSFAFWEWITCVALSVYIAILSLAVPAAYSASAQEAGEQ